MKAQLKEKTEANEKLMKQLADLEGKHENEEDLKQKIHAGHKQLAIKDQKIEFLEIQLTETRSQLDEANRQHQSMVEAMNNSQADLQSVDEEKIISESPQRSERLQQ